MLRIITILALLIFPSLGYGQSIKSFTPTLLYSGANTPGGATFQAHNRLIARTTVGPHAGCYATHIYKQSTPTFAVALYSALWWSPTCEPPWSLMDSFGPYGGGAPAVLVDELGDVFWLVSDDQSSQLRIRKYFCGASDICLDRQERIWPGYSSTKWTAMYQEHCHRIFVSSFFPADHTFSIFDQAGNLVDSYAHTVRGTISGLEYPWLEESQDEMISGWVTTAISATTPGYDGIHYMVNNNCGARANWYTPQDGTSRTPAVVADDSGPTPEMRQGFTPAPPTSIWMGALALTKRLNVHMAYASPNGPSPTTETEFVYHSMGAPGSWARIALHDNLLQGGATSKVGGTTLTIQEIRGSSACYFKGGDGALYLMGPSKEADTSGNNWIDVLKSTDDGVTWNDFAQSTNTHNIYALNCNHQGIETSPDVWSSGDQIVGIFTEITTPSVSYPQQVWSFHLPIAP